jgi:hypothetical protein
MNLRGECIKDLRSAIQMLRDACDRAEQQVLRENITPEEMIAVVNHEFLWGLANASTGIQNALSDCSRERERREAGI